MILLDCNPQRLFELERFADLSVHGRRKDAETFAACFGAVHGVVGVPFENLGGSSVSGIGADADAATDRNHAGRGRHGGRDRLAQVAANGRGLLVCAFAWNQHEKFVAAHARHVAGHHRKRAETIGDDAENVIACAVAELIVDALEAVEVDPEDGESLFALAGSLDGRLQRLFPGAPVGNSGERILVCVAHQLVVNAAMLDDQGSQAGCGFCQLQVALRQPGIQAAIYRQGSGDFPIGVGAERNGPPGKNSIRHQELAPRPPQVGHFFDHAWLARRECLALGSIRKIGADAHEIAPQLFVHLAAGHQLQSLSGAVREVQRALPTAPLRRYGCGEVLKNVFRPLLVRGGQHLQHLLLTADQILCTAPFFHLLAQLAGAVLNAPLERAPLPFEGKLGLFATMRLTSCAAMQAQAQHAQGAAKNERSDVGGGIPALHLFEIAGEWLAFGGNTPA